MTQSNRSNTQAPVRPGDVALLATLAALPLREERCAAVADTLNAWLRDANELSAKMNEEAHRDLLPATVFAHGSRGEEEGQGS